MRLYIVAEDLGSDYLLPRWLEILLPGWRRLDRVDGDESRAYYLIAGGGYPQIHHHRDAAIQDIASDPGHFSGLLILVDAGSDPADLRRSELASLGDQVLPCPLCVVVVDPCLEGWALGNRAFIGDAPTHPPLLEWIAHYDVRERDPERLPSRTLPNASSPLNAEQSADRYLNAAHVARGAVWSKSRPRELAKPTFLKALVDRTRATDHLRSFRDLLAWANLWVAR